LDWIVDWRKSRIGRQVRDGIDGDQPKLTDILDELERLEDSEEVKKEIEKLRSGRERFPRKKDKERNYNNNNNNQEVGGNAFKNKCRIHGHNHEWSACPKNFRNKKNDEADANHVNDCDDDEPDDREIEDCDEFCMECIDSDVELEETETDDDVPDLEDYEITSSDEENDIPELCEDDTDSEDEVPDLMPRVDPEVIGVSDNENVNYAMEKKKAKKVQFDTTCNTYAILEDTSDSDEDAVPDLITRRESVESDSDSDTDSDSEDEAWNKKINEERPNVFNRGRKATKPSKARATCTFSLPDKNGKYIEYQGLLDTGSTRGLISADIVEIHGLKVKADNGCWTTNTGRFETNQKAVIKNLKLPNFTRKRTIKLSTLSINPNETQKYKAIFGLDFLVANGIDFINSEEKIRWDGISIPMNDESYANDVKMRANRYRSYTPEEIINFANQKHLTTEEKDKLKNLLRNSKISLMVQSVHRKE